MSITQALSDDDLLRKTQKIVALERRLSVHLIFHLQEVERRRLHLKRGFSSLYDYLIRGLGYSGGAAHRRIKAMEICREVPELARKIESGQTNLTQAMLLQGHFEKEEKLSGHVIAPEAKSELFSELEGKSTRDTKRALAALRPEAAKPDKKRELSADLTHISFTADRELMEMLERIKNLSAHQRSNSDLLGLFKLMAKKTLERLDPLERAKRARKAKGSREQSRGVSVAPAAGNLSGAEVNADDAQISTLGNLGTSSAPRTQTPAPGNPYKPDAVFTPRTPRRARRPDAATLYAIHARDQGCCQFKDPETGRKCGSKRVIQTEHKIPFAQGGETEWENLELLCRSHNQLRAIEAYGAETMAGYLRGDLKKGFVPSEGEKPTPQTVQTNGS